jgi:hypothetical protein
LKGIERDRKGLKGIEREWAFITKRKWIRERVKWIERERKELKGIERD